MSIIATLEKESRARAENLRVKRRRCVDFLREFNEAGAPWFVEQDDTNKFSLRHNNRELLNIECCPESINVEYYDNDQLEGTVFLDNEPTDLKTELVSLIQSSLYYHGIEL